MKRKSNWFLSLVLPAGVLVPIVAALTLTSASAPMREGLDAAVRASMGASTAISVEPVKVPEKVPVETPEKTPVLIESVTVPESETVHETPAPSKLAICLAAAYALNPEWDPTICDRMRNDTDVANPRKERCRRQRASLQKFAETLCATIVEETTRENLDLLLPLAIIERETSGGRVEYNQSMKIFQVNTDVCEWFLSARRIVSREPGTRRAGTEILVWTYGDEQLTNRQAVLVTGDEMPRGLRINTCVAGEEGIMQTIPREWKRGTVVEATGEILRGTTDERRARVEADPVLQVRLGCQALAEHREICPESSRLFWPDWLPTYNLGVCDSSREHWLEYNCKVMKHYLDACIKGWIPVENSVPLLLLNVWPACRSVQTAYEERCRVAIQGKTWKSVSGTV